jgi:hypothetical protein
VADQEVERTGVLVLSAWLEAHGPPLRTRITSHVGLPPAEEASVTVAGVEEATRVVHDWLVELERRSAPSLGRSRPP